MKKLILLFSILAMGACKKEDKDIYDDSGCVLTVLERFQLTKADALCNIDFENERGFDLFYIEIYEDSENGEPLYQRISENSCNRLVIDVREYNELDDVGFIIEATITITETEGIYTISYSITKGFDKLQLSQPSIPRNASIKATPCDDDSY